MLIVTFVVMGVILNLVYYPDHNSTENWKLLSKDSEGWTYWQSTKYPNICTLYRDVKYFWGVSVVFSESMTYIPCKEILK